MRCATSKIPALTGPGATWLIGPVADAAHQLVDRARQLLTLVAVEQLVPRGVLERHIHVVGIDHQGLLAPLMAHHEHERAVLPSGVPFRPVELDPAPVLGTATPGEAEASGLEVRLAPIDHVAQERIAPPLDGRGAIAPRARRGAAEPWTE